MINIVITAGGTIENIDEVRKITNTSTGKLGAHICTEIIKYIENSSYNKQFNIHYVMSKTAYKPTIDNRYKDNIVFYEITDTLSVEKTINSILDNNKIDCFIHSMAISDFYTSSIITVEDLAQEIFEKISHESNKEKYLNVIKETLSNPECILNKNKKVSSKSDIMITLKTNPKIISMIKERNKNIFLVGFKLLRNVTEEELLKAANKLTVENDCNLVLANDLKYINEGRHIGLIIKDNKVINRYEGKENIAKGLVLNMFKGGMDK
jgi:phosphopantothenate-cysteine ligase